MLSQQLKGQARERCDEGAPGLHPLARQGVKEQGFDKSNGRVLVEVNPRFFRPAEVDILCGDASKARNALGWLPKEKFADLVKEMVRHDVQLLKGH